MTQTSVLTHNEFEEQEFHATAQLAHTLMRLLLAVRYRKNLVVAVMAAAALLGGLFFATATRRYAAKAALLITQTGHDRLDTSITNEDLQRQNTMPTFENMIRSAKVLEGALKNLAPGDRIDLAGVPKEGWIGRLQKNLDAKAIRSTSILQVEYRSKDPQVAVNVVRAVVQSYLDFMDQMHKGTAGDISRMLTHEREELSNKLAKKQEELLDCRRHFADMGFRSDGKTLHPTVQRAVYFNDALIAAQKERVEHEALLATIQTAIVNGEDLGQYLITVGDAVGPGNAVELPRPRRPRRQHAGQPGAELDCRPRRSANGHAEPRPQASRGGRACRKGPADRTVSRFSQQRITQRHGGTPQEPNGALVVADGAAEAG